MGCPVPAGLNGQPGIERLDPRQSNIWQLEAELRIARGQRILKKLSALLARAYQGLEPGLDLQTSPIFRTRSGWLYLAVVMDLCSRRVIGWAMESHMRAELVCQALIMAQGQRNPAEGVLLHSDRGSQYASEEYQALLKKHKMVCSMSRKGNCWDNAPMERFFLNLKMERVWRRDYANQEEARRDVADYLLTFYNQKRLNSALGNMRPGRV